MVYCGCRNPILPSFPGLTNCDKRRLARSNQADICINQKELISRHRQLNGNPSATAPPSPSPASLCGRNESSTAYLVSGVYNKFQYFSGGNYWGSWNWFLSLSLSCLQCSSWCKVNKEEKLHRVTRRWRSPTLREEREGSFPAAPAQKQNLDILSRDGEWDKCGRFSNVEFRFKLKFRLSDEK